MPKFLVISDTHITPSNVGVNKPLWQGLADYVLKTKPDCIVHLGDVGDFSSQAWLKKDRGQFELVDELAAVEDCLQSFHNIINEYNRVQRLNKKKMYKPYFLLTLGNHDVRNGMTDVQDLFEAYRWKVVDYLEPFTISGVTFCHAMHRGLSDTFCTTAKELVENWHSNVIVGHGHKKDFYESYSLAINDRITGLRCPSFGLDNSEWAIQTGNKWSKGFTEVYTEPFRFIWRDIEHDH